MNPISDAVKNKLQKAAEKVVDHVETGMTPDEALAKVAFDQDLEPGHIRLVGRAYNIGETTRIREHGESVLDKSAAFLVCDPEAVIDSLYPSSTKVVSKSATVSTHYSQPPAKLLKYLVTMQETEVLRKAAGELNADWCKSAGMCETPVAKSTTKPVDKFRKLEQLKREKNQKSAALAAHYDQLVKNASDLKVWFSQPGHVRLADFSNVFDGKLSLSAESVLTYVESLLPDQVAKSAGCVLFDNTQVAEAVAYLDQAADAYEAIKQASDDLDRCSAEYDSLHTELLNLKPTAPASILDAIEKEASVPPFVNAAVFGGMSNIGRNVSEGLLGNEDDDESLVLKQISKIDSPDHKKRLQAIRQQVMLDDMFNNDPVISGYDPEEIASAYNRIASLGPTVANNPLLMESQLRRYLSQGQMDPFEGRAIVDTETAMRKQVAGDGNSSRKDK